MFSRYKYDVFISHAVEDKLPIANDLCKHLEKAGLRVWYSGADLQAGDSIHETIRIDLPKSRYAVVILSEHYLSKKWTMKEYYMLQAQEKAGRKVILPVLFDITAADLQDDVYMADKFAIPYAKGMDHVIHKLLEVIKGSHPKRTPRRWLSAKRAILAVSALLMTMVSLLYTFSAQYPVPDTAFVQQTIQQRMADYQSKLNSEVSYENEAQKASVVRQEEIINVFTEFLSIKSYYRNEYEFSNDYKVSRFKKNVEADLNISLDRLKPANAYGFSRANMYLAPRQRNGLVDQVAYAFVNTMPASYTITYARVLENGDYEVTVTYTENIRVVRATLTFPFQDLPKRYQVLFKGFSPVEKYIFRQSGEVWAWTALE